MSALTLDEAVDMVTDIHEAGFIDLTAAIVILLAATGMSAGLCRRLIEREITDRRRDDWVPHHEWDGRWKR